MIAHGDTSGRLEQVALEEEVERAGEDLECAYRELRLAFLALHHAVVKSNLERKYADPREETERRRDLLEHVREGIGTINAALYRGDVDAVPGAGLWT